MQSAYIGKLMELAQKDKNIVHLLADSGTGYDELFRRNFPHQIYNFGISEETMAAAAAGMASVGKIPFLFTAGAFLVYRALEFIRDDICFQNLNVKITGMGSGLAWSSLGPTHHTTEDLAVLWAMPNLRILSPATPIQVSASVALAYALEGPVYIRIGMNHEKEFFDETYNMRLSQNDVIRPGSDTAIFTTGSILEEVDEAAARLAADGIFAQVICVSTIKPFDAAGALEAMSGKKWVFSVEEHNIYGGLGSRLAQAAAYEGLGIRLGQIGLNDVFAAGYGSQKEVRRVNGLDAESIYKKIKDTLYYE